MSDDPMRENVLARVRHLQNPRNCEVSGGYEDIWNVAIGVLLRDLESYLSQPTRDAVLAKRLRAAAIGDDSRQRDPGDESQLAKLMREAADALDRLREPVGDEEVQALCSELNDWSQRSKAEYHNTTARLTSQAAALIERLARGNAELRKKNV